MIWFYVVGVILLGAVVYKAIKNASFRNLFIVPLVLHLAIFSFASLYDPCNNNPGCMAGSLTAYFFILCTLPTIIILCITSLIQNHYLKSQPNKSSKYFKINIFIALVSFVLVFVFFIVMKSIGGR